MDFFKRHLQAIIPLIAHSGHTSLTKQLYNTEHYPSPNTSFRFRLILMVNIEHQLTSDFLFPIHQLGLGFYAWMGPWVNSHPPVFLPYSAAFYSVVPEANKDIFILCTSCSDYYGTQLIPSVGSAPHLAVFQSVLHFLGVQFLELMSLEWTLASHCCGRKDATNIESIHSLGMQDIVLRALNQFMKSYDQKICFSTMIKFKQQF